MITQISVGELLDKITILEIKAFLTNDEYVHKELEDLNKIKSTLTQDILKYEIQLKEVNKKLWEIEDKIRQLEREQRFDQEFIDLARSIYLTNDERAKIKKKINEITNSSYREVKIY